MIAAFVLCALIGLFLLDTIAKLLNISVLGNQLPPEFVDIYDASQYQKSQAYTRAQTWFDLTSEGFQLLVVLGFWFAGGFEKLDQGVRATQITAPWNGLLYFAVLFVGRQCLALPFEIFQTFVVEQRFGFNRTSVRTFVVDHFRSLLLTGFIGGGVAALVLTLLEYWGLQAWYIAWAATAALSLVLVYLAPKLILPWFFKFTPLPEGSLRDKIEAYCHLTVFPVRELSVIDGSRRSLKANAFFAGFGKNKRIALYDTLIQKHSEDELVAVIAHEVGHFKNQHLTQHLLFAQLNLLLFFLLASFCLARPEIYEAFGVSRPSYYVGLVLFSILMQPLGFLLAIFSNAWSRHNEYEADRFAKDSTGSADPLVAALKKLSKNNLSNLTPHPLLVGLHFTHPPVVDRIRRLST